MQTTNDNRPLACAAGTRAADTLQSYGFLPYQQAWLENHSRFKIGLWARQTGKDFTCAAEAVLDCLSKKNTCWVILGAGERQALETLAKAAEWTHRFLRGARPVVGRGSRQALLGGGATPITGEARLQPSPSFPQISTHKILFPNGSRIIALPANAQTIRGYSANLILTEFAFHEQGEQIWRAIYPSISNPMKGGLKKVRIISTPNGLNNKFAQLWNTLDDLWYKSRVTIDDAVAQGLPIQIGEVRTALNDPQAWTQEYECQFIDTSSVLLPYELIATCESPEAIEHSNPLDLSKHTGQLFAGIDFGRKQHLTVCWILERVPAHALNHNRNLSPSLPDSRSSISDCPSFSGSSAPSVHSVSKTRNSHILLTREVLTLQDCSTPDQIAALLPRLRRIARVSVDYTGAGIGLGDYLVKELREYNPAQHKHGKVELCQFTPALKAELFPKLRVAFENRDVFIPGTRDIREDLHGLQRIVTPQGQITYRALAKPDGHSDRCTALALALRAAASMPYVYSAPVIIDHRAIYYRRHGRY